MACNSTPASNIQTMPYLSLDHQNQQPVEGTCLGIKDQGFERFRCALDKERRARKALCLVRTRDRRIAYLEKRVTELEKTTVSLYAISLRASSMTTYDSQGRGSHYAADITFGENSNMDENSEDVTRSSRLRHVCAGREKCKLCEDQVSPTRNRLPVPHLRLSNSSTSNSDKDVYCTPSDNAPRKNSLSDTKEDCLILSTCNYNLKRRDIKGPVNVESLFEESFRDKDLLKNDRHSALIKKDPKTIPDKNSIGIVKCVSNVPIQNCEKNIQVIFRARQLRPKHPARISASFPRIRKRIHGFLPKRRMEREGLRTDAVHAEAAAYRSTEGRLCGGVGGEYNDSDAISKVNVEVDPKEDAARSPAQEAKIIADEKKQVEKKEMTTQTSNINIDEEQRILRIKETMNINHSPLSFVGLEDKKSSTFWSVEDDLAPQWLIEEALGRGTKECKDYETIISELEEKLGRTKADLEDALRQTFIVKEKYKRILENVNADASKEMLQEKMVRICTSILEKFGTFLTPKNRRNFYQLRKPCRLRCYERISKKLHRKLRVAVKASNKLKRELAATRKALKDKSTKYDSMNKCFSKLKQEMENTEINLNNLIAENVSLRQKIEDTREWVENKIGKEQQEKGSGTQLKDIPRCRELMSLKKKAEEDSATVAQLRNKLLKLESANANKGFLLNSYKGQLTDLTTQKDELLTKISGLESELCVLRHKNSQLKAKISWLNIDKEKSASNIDKPRTHLLESTDLKSDQKIEESMQMKIEDMKNKYEKNISVMKIQVKQLETQNFEYSKAIQEFLKKIYNFYERSEENKSFGGNEDGEREAHRTACKILNMSPSELSGFIKGKPPSSINSWITELNKITSKTKFSKILSKFLYQRTLKK